MSNVKPFWTDEKIESLRTYWAAGYPAIKIASEIGASSKNVVIGKARRLKLPTHIGAISLPETHPDRRKSPKRAAQVSRHHPIKPAPTFTADAAEIVALPEANEPLPESRLLALFDLKTTTCRWPLGDPQERSFVFCGADCDPVRSYCPTHTQISRGVGSRGERAAHTVVLA